MRGKVFTASEAVSCLRDGSVIGISGVNVVGVPFELIDAIARLYREKQRPKSITVINSANNGGVHILAAEGLIGKYIAGFPTLDACAEGPGFLDGDKIPVFSLTQGIAAQFYGAQAAGVPYLMRHIPGTYLDPAVEGGCANEKARELAKTEPLVKPISIGGEEYLHIDMPKVDAVLIRASVSDELGNLSDCDEMVKCEILPMAMAARNNGGTVIAQVDRLVEQGQLDAADVKVPGMLVDRVVICSDPKRFSPQNHTGVYQPGVTGRYRVAPETIPFDIWAPAGEKLVMARRAAMEINPGNIVNFGLGAPMGVPYVTAAEGVQDMYYPTVELGAIGGYPGGGPFFSGAFNPDAFLRHDEMFSFINGGGLDMTFLGAAEIGRDGSVNVSRFAGRTNGSGGFINISSNTKKIIFMCLHTSGGKPKFIPEVGQVTFCGPEAAQKGRDVAYITERAVFRLIDGKVTLTEAAEGLDIEKDVIGAMGFRPAVSDCLKPIPAECFSDRSLGLRQRWEGLLATARSAP